MSGPNNFIRRLMVELDKMDLPPFQIINPGSYSKTPINKKIVNIGRLDGVMYYKTTNINLRNYLRQNNIMGGSLIKHIPSSITSKLTGPFNNYLNRFNRKLIKHSDAIVFQSQLSKDMHSHFIGGIDSIKYSDVILNGVPADIFRPHSKTSVELEGYPRLVITASFRLHKRLQEAIKLTNYLHTHGYPSIKLHVIGDMDLLTQEMLKSMNLLNTILHGVLNSDVLPNFYNSCDIGLSPSIFDPCPNSVVEMMSCGLPVITVRESGASELINIEELLITEGIKLDYHELHTLEKIPQINISDWSVVVAMVLDNMEYYRFHILDRVEKSLDMKIIAKRYAKLITETNEFK